MHLALHDDQGREIMNGSRPWHISTAAHTSRSPDPSQRTSTLVEAVRGTILFRERNSGPDQ